MLALHAAKSPRPGQFDFTPFNAKGKAFKQHVSNLVSCRFNNPSESLPWDVHLFRCLIMVKPIKIGQPDSLKLIHG
jgi:hypothetical protein